MDNSRKTEEVTSAHRGQKVLMDYPLDKSSKGTPGNVQSTMKGSPDNLSHSLTGVRAVQGPDKGGRKDTVKY